VIPALMMGSVGNLSGWTPMNRRIRRHFRVSFRTVLVSAVLLVVALPVSAEELAVARYSTLRAVPTLAQRDPLADLVTTTFPASVTRVGEAIETVLAPSGYRLAGAQATDPGRAALLALPLPAVHRTLGPLPLRLALQTLAGPVFTVVEDPLHRLVSFERCDSGTSDQVP
jgi:type IV pili sensor histidine kinase/response regulator